MASWSEHQSWRLEEHTLPDSRPVCLRALLAAGPIVEWILNPVEKIGVVRKRSVEEEIGTELSTRYEWS